MESTLINKYKDLLKKCLDKGISLDIIQQIILTSQLPQANRIVENLSKIVNKSTERQMKRAIAKEIEKQ